MKVAVLIMMSLLAGMAVGQTNRINPIMTSSNTPSPYVVTDYIAGGGYVWNHNAPENALDQNQNTYWYLRRDYWYNSVQGSWMKLDLGSSPTNLSMYRAFFNGNMLTNTMLTGWKLQGSNNDSDWTDLDVKSGYSFPNVSNGRTASNGSSFTNYFVIPPENVASYRYIRFYVSEQPPVSESGGANVFYLYELELYNVYTPPPPPPCSTVILSTSGTGMVVFK